MFKVFCSYILIMSLSQARLQEILPQNKTRNQPSKQRNHNNPPSNKNCISICFYFLSFPHKHSVTIAYEALTCGMAGFMDGNPMDRVE